MASLRPPAEGPFNIRRKPVSNPNLRETAISQPLFHAATSPALIPERSPPPSYNELYGPGPSSLSPGNTLTRPRTADASPTPTPTSSISTTEKEPTSIQKAYTEARHFLGGLITHPSESTKHTTILRHSHGLIFYRGTSTSLTISLFSDTPLPPDRTLWLQNRGWTGNTGMRTKALFRIHNSWVDVTPTIPVDSSQVNPHDERAWQRDIKKFQKKASPRASKHVLRETVVLRVPAEIGDGYFQVVLCEGQKKRVLGNSPVFRVLSTSTTPSSLRGASLSTLPLELGALVASLYAQTAAQAVLSPATAAVKSRVEPYRPSWVTRMAAQSVSQNVVGGVRSGFGSAGAGAGANAGANAGGRISAEEAPVGITSVELGPHPPFPMVFKARAESIPSELGSVGQMVRLSGVPSWVPERLRGYFFGWTRSDKESMWYPIILSIRTLDPLQSRVDLSQLSKLVIKLRLLEEMHLGRTLEIRVMGFLRDEIPPPTGNTREELAVAQATAAEASILADAYDESIVQTTLGNAAWAPDLHLQEAKGWVDRTKEGCVNMQSRGQKLVEKVPLYRLGVRSATDQARESQAVNGFYIVR